MPATSKAQRQAMAIAEHHPEKLHAENRGMLKMSHEDLHDFASTKESGLPAHKAFKAVADRLKKRKHSAMKAGMEAGKKGK